jgi:hypothetical protein
MSIGMACSMAGGGNGVTRRSKTPSSCLDLLAASDLSPSCSLADATMRPVAVLATTISAPPKTKTSGVCGLLRSLRLTWSRNSPKVIDPSWSVSASSLLMPLTIASVNADGLPLSAYASWNLWVAVRIPMKRPSSPSSACSS